MDDNLKPSQQASDNSNSIPDSNNPVIPSTEPGSSSNALKPASKFSIKAIIGTIIFLLLAGGAAAGYVYREPIMKFVSKPTPTPTVILSGTKDLSPTPDPDSVWTIFKGNGFEFSHPVNAPVSKGHGIIAVSYIESIPTDYPKVKEPIIGYIIDFGYSSLGSESLKSKAEKRIASDGIHLDEITKPITKIIIGSYEGLTYSSIVDKQPQSHVFLKSGTNYIDIAYFSNDPNNKGYQTIIDRILSTFKFTDDQTTNTSSWKTFKGNGFTIKYPPTWNINGNDGLITSNNYPYVGPTRPPGDFGFRGGYINFIYPSTESSINEYTQGEVTRETITINSIKAQKVTGKSGPLGEVPYTTIIIKHNNKTLLINYYTMDSQSIPQTEFEQILSTLEFTNPSSTCTPRPKCLDATPRCLIPEPIEGWCK